MVAKKEPLRMPKMDGIAAAREIRGKYLCVKVIGLSSMRTDIAQTRWKKLGPWGLPKVEARGGQEFDLHTNVLPAFFIGIRF